jgi:site-specific recombinase XerD
VLEELDRYWRAERKGQPGERGPWLFIAPDPARHLNDSSGQSIYYRALRKSGVRQKGGIHVLRHSFATHLIESGVEISLIQRLMGHNNLTTTARYLHVTAHRLDRVRSALDLIQGVCVEPAEIPRRR